MRSAIPENLTLEPTSGRLAKRLRSYGHFSISKMAASRRLGFLESKILAIPKNPTVEPNVMPLSRTELEVWKFKYLIKMKAHLGFC